MKIESAMRELCNCSLLPYHTFGMDVKARCLIEYDSADDLRAALARVRSVYAGKPLLHIGGGSNLLFLNDFDGVVLHSRIEGITRVRSAADKVWLRVGAGMVWDAWVDYCVAHHYCGLENLTLIPGEVGASAVQNIGAYGVEAKDFITEVETVDLQTGEERVFTHAECRYAYRQSIFKQELRGRYAVTHVTFCLTTDFRPSLDYGGIRRELASRGLDAEQVSPADLRRVVADIRRSKLPDPAVWGNAGSFFMNPVIERDAYEKLVARYPDMPCYEVDERRVKVPAGWMIDRCGWKGRTLGRAAVHDKQALVLVNRGGATGAEIRALSDAVRQSVRETFGIDIHPEVNFIE